MEANKLALGTEPALLNEGGLLSALGRPYHGYHVEIHDKAAALVHAIILNHPFMDGNKRTALYLSELLVKRSGYKLTVEDIELFDKLILIAKGEMGYDEIVGWMSTIIEPLDQF